MDVRAVELPVEGQIIRGKLYLPEGEPKQLAILFLHGWTGKPNDAAAAFLTEQGFIALTIGMRGHGDSDGDINHVTRQDSLIDVLAAYDYLVSQVPKDTKIVVVGNSYGGYMATILSHERPVAVLSLRVPASYPDEGFTDAQMGQGNANPATMEWRQTAVSYAGNRAFEAIHGFQGPAQIIEAEFDDYVPHQSVENYRHAVLNPNAIDDYFMKGWPHSLGDDPQRNADFQKILVEWLNKLATEV